MDSQQLSQKLSVLLQSLDATEGLQPAVRILAEKYQSLRNMISESRIDNAQQFTEKVVGLISGTQKEIRTLPLRALFAEAEQLRTTASFVERQIALDVHISTSLDVFASRLEKNIQGGTRGDVVDLLFAANDLLVDITHLNAVTQFLRSHLAPRAPVDNAIGSVSIRFGNSSDYKQLMRRLKALGDIYEEIARLVGISTSDSPLEISKIESGSLWTVLSGDAGVIKAMGGLIKSAAVYIYETYSEKGRVEWSARAISQQLDLREKLKSAGIDTVAVDEELSRSAVRLAKRTTDLLQGESIVEIDNHEISISSHLREKFIEESQRQLLRGTDDETNDA